jgi:DNA-binding CsgD family transcriptional regulator
MDAFATTVAFTLVETLTPRETDVLCLLAQGKNYHDIAAALHVSYRTARSHAEHLYAKLGVTTALEAVVQAHARGLVRLGGLSPAALAVSQLLAAYPHVLDELRQFGILRGA